MEENKFEHLSTFKKALLTIAFIIHIAVWSVCKAAAVFAVFVIIGAIYAAPVFLVLMLAGVDISLNGTISGAVAVVACYLIESTVDDYMTEDEKKKYFG